MLWKSGQGSKSIIQRFELIKFATRYLQKELNSLLLPEDLYWDFYFILFSYHRFSLLFKKKPTVQKWEEKSKKKIMKIPLYVEVTCIQILEKVSPCIYVVSRYLVLFRRSISRFGPPQMVVDKNLLIHGLDVLKAFWIGPNVL